MRELLCCLLSCGYLDLNVLENCSYDIDELIDYTKDMGYEKPDLNSLAYAMFRLASNDLSEYISEEIEKVEGELSELEGLKSELDGKWDDELTDEEVETIDTIDERINSLNEKLVDIKALDPSEDIESYHNYLDTHVYFRNNESIYRQYCQDGIDLFLEKTGFDL